MSVNGITVWLNPLLVLVGLAVLFSLQTRNQPAVVSVEPAVQVVASPLGAQ